MKPIQILQKIFVGLFLILSWSLHTGSQADSYSLSSGKGIVGFPESFIQSIIAVESVAGSLTVEGEVAEAVMDFNAETGREIFIVSAEFVGQTAHIHFEGRSLYGLLTSKPAPYNYHSQ